MTEFAPAIVEVLSFGHKPTPKQLKIMGRHKIRFPNDEDTLRIHLGLLSLDVLTPYLVWIPPQEFDERQLVDKGGFADVERATIKLGESKIEVALKNINFGRTIDLKNEASDTLVYFYWFPPACHPGRWLIRFYIRHVLHHHHSFSTISTYASTAAPAGRQRHTSLASP